jgi:hypothetical protein
MSGQWPSIRRAVIDINYGDFDVFPGLAPSPSAVTGFRCDECETDHCSPAL